MPAISDIALTANEAPAAGLSTAQFAAASAAVAVLGLSLIAPAVSGLWTMWTTDALKSIGMVVPVVSFLLVLRAWKRIGWHAGGTWWAVPLLLSAAVGAWINGGANLVVVFSPEDTRIFPPTWTVMLVYGIGAVLLLGGVRLLRAALFPVLLLALVNPAPHIFTTWIDLPLQRLSAEVARSLAIHLGYSLTPDRLRLMFTPDFGMFIAPGCNGMRGAVTMGMIALVAGYYYGFRWIATAMVTAGAVLLGYLFNLLRLCLLVFYYVIAMHLHWLENKAEQADYVIGGALFLIAAVLLFSMIHRLRERSPAPAPAPETTAPARADAVARGQWLRLLTMAAMAIAAWFTVPQAVALGGIRAVPAGMQPFPAKIGTYTLARTWNENGGDDNSTVVYLWAQYAPEGGGAPLALGISPVADWHNPVICHSVRGETAEWEGQMTAATATTPVEFSSALYNDGVTQLLEATTLCNRDRCGESVTRPAHFGLVSDIPRFSTVRVRPSRSIRVLLKVENLDPNESAAAARSEMTAVTQRFLAHADLAALTKQFAE